MFPQTNDYKLALKNKLEISKRRYPTFCPPPPPTDQEILLTFDKFGGRFHTPYQPHGLHPCIAASNRRVSLN